MTPLLPTFGGDSQESKAKLGNYGSRAELLIIANNCWREKRFRLSRVDDEVDEINKTNSINCSLDIAEAFSKHQSSN